MKRITHLIWPQSTWLLASIALVIVTLFISCDKNETKGRLQLKMVDKPTADAKEVWVEIEGVELKMNDDQTVTLDNVHAGMYNLLELTGGKDTLLADADIPAGSISQLRLILGDNNYIITSTGEKIDLTTPSAQQSGLKVQIHQTIEGGVLYRLTLDFDAARSIVKAGNSGNYILKPVLRILSFAPSGGNLQGVVVPDSVLTKVIAIQGLDTIAATYTNTLNGNWYIKDVPAGSYSLFFIPSDSNYVTAQKIASVSLGQTTTVDTVALQH